MKRKFLVLLAALLLSGCSVGPNRDHDLKTGDTAELRVTTVGAYTRGEFATVYGYYVWVDNGESHEYFDVGRSEAESIEQGSKLLTGETYKFKIIDDREKYPFQPGPLVIVVP